MRATQPAQAESSHMSSCAQQVRGDHPDIGRSAR